MTPPLTALCVGRHRFLSEHIGRYFRRIGLETRWVVGLEAAVMAAHADPPDVVICDYDLLTSASSHGREHDGAIRDIPIVAISLTRRPDHTHQLLDGVGFGYLYLPTVARSTALRYLEAARQTPGQGWSQPSVAFQPA
jgi:hypothetical protein